MFVQVHVQVHAFPRVCLKTMLGERAVITVGQLWGNFGTIFGACWSILRPLGTILGPLGIRFEAPFPRFGQNVDFRRFSGESPTRLGMSFSPLGDTCSLSGASEAEHRCFFMQPGLR